MGLVTDWATIVGERIARRSQPEKMIYRGSAKSKATLHIRVEGALGVELNHIKPMIIERINQYFGFQAVADIRLHQKPLRRGLRPKPEITRIIPDVPKPENQDANGDVIDSIISVVRKRDALWREIIGPDMAALFPTARFMPASNTLKKWDVFINYNEGKDNARHLDRKSRLSDLRQELAAPREFLRDQLEGHYGSMAIGRIAFNVDWYGERLVI